MLLPMLAELSEHAGNQRKEAGSRKRKLLEELLRSHKCY